MMQSQDKMRAWSDRLAQAMENKLGISLDQDNTRLVLQLVQSSDPAHTKAFASYLVKKLAGQNLSQHAANAALFSVKKLFYDLWVIDFCF
jgi:hypothetical protein